MIRFHDLRHTAATLLLERGVNPKEVSEMLGHASVAVTLTLYGHVTPHMQHEAAATMERTLGSIANRRERIGELGSKQGSTGDLSRTEEE
jgi:hypothetical protein